MRVQVPVGTVINERNTHERMGDLLEAGQELVVATGGRHGLGNARFKSSINRAPRKTTPGKPGEQRDLDLELKLLADVGLLGQPNAGKSTFIRAVSAARPKIADYPFTTLVPQLGVVAPNLDSDPFVIADLPGLIEGAADGAGLGHRFLRHVERCRVLLHLVDLAPEESAAAEVEAIEHELAAFNASLLERPRLLVGTKLDAALDGRREQLRQAARERGLPYLEISAVTREGVDPLVRRIQTLLAEVAE